MLPKMNATLKNIAGPLQSLFLLAIRLYWGYLFAKAGWGKLIDLQGTSHFLAQIGLPFPYLHALLVAVVEFVGGIFLMLGLFARLAAIPLLITMLVALWLTARDALTALFSSGDPSTLFLQTPFLFGYTCLIILLFGPGKLALDYFFNGETGSYKPQR